MKPGAFNPINLVQTNIKYLEATHCFTNVMGIGAHPKLALIFTEYTIHGASFLYWLETGIYIIYSPTIDYGRKD
jgi:hypothetical protein